VTTLAPLPLRSWKVQRDEQRARLVPREDGAGAPFEGPGIDVVGAELAPVLAAIAPVVALVEAREPGATVRSLSFDLGRGRCLATLRYEEPAQGRVHAIRLDEPECPALFVRAREAEPTLGAIAATVLARRTVQSTRA